jgi:AcrR family transcriptional regulator
MKTVETVRRSARKAKGSGRLGRAEILEAAERVFAAGSYEGTTFGDVAEEVGVSPAHLELHFPDKAAILLEIGRRTFADRVKRNSRIAALPIDPGARIRLMLVDYMVWAFEHLDAYQLVFSPSHAVSAVLHEATADLSARCYEICAGVVRELAAEGRLRAGTAECATQVLWASGHGVVALVRCLPAFNWASRDELIAVTADGLLGGLFVD